jgi:hypothetical protein
VSDRVNGGLEGIWKETAISQLKVSFGTCQYELNKTDVECLNNPNMEKQCGGINFASDGC